MNARYIPRIDLHDRLELKNALPMETPYVIHIDPCDTCNFSCKFCPCGSRMFTPSGEFVEILNFRHFARYFSFAKNGEIGRKKELLNGIEVSVVLHLV